MHNELAKVSVDWNRDNIAKLAGRIIQGPKRNPGDKLLTVKTVTEPVGRTKADGEQVRLTATGECDTDGHHKFCLVQYVLNNMEYQAGLFGTLKGSTVQHTLCGNCYLRKGNK